MVCSIEQAKFRHRSNNVILIHFASLLIIDYHRKTLSFFKAISVLARLKLGTRGEDVAQIGHTVKFVLGLF